MPHRYRLTRAAEADYVNILRRTLRDFGRPQFDAYRALLNRAFAVIAEDPLRLNSKQRDELGHGIRTFHIGTLAPRKGAARHFLVYRTSTVDDAVDILRILHDSMEIARHLAGFHE
jgi:toxin ParE1/3/4